MFNPQNLIYFLFLLLFTSSLSAQKETFGRTYQDSLPSDFKLNVAELRDHIHSGIPKEENMENFERQILRFSDINAISIASQMESGEIYSDWPAMDSYLNKVLKRVIPDELKEEKMIKAYLVKDGDFNAYMTATGHMFINVGVFAMVEDEATLAGIMAHEIGHYYLRHGFETFVKAENKEFQLRMSTRKVDYYKFSENNELDCDSLSLIWLEKAGYNFKGAIRTMQILEKLEENQLMKLKDVWEIKKSTHPRGEKRVAKLQEYAKKMASKSLENFIVGEEEFTTLRKEAKTEILKHLLHDYSYSNCIEAAFKFHLEDAENTTYLYYLLEGIRRAGTLDNNFWNKEFITHNYYVVNDKEKKVKIDKHIFEDFFSDILLISQSKFNDLPTKFYWEGDPKFITNEQAFEFFARVGELLNEPECIFSNALSVSFDRTKYQPLLKKYLEFENVRFKEYAEHMLNGTLRSSLPEKSVAVVNDFSPFVKQGDEYIYIRDEHSNRFAALIKEQLTPAFKEYSKIIYLPQLIDNKLNDYSILQEMSLYARLKIAAKGQRINPHMLDPRFWEVMKQFNVNEFDFYELDFRDVEKNIQTVESYQAVMGYNTKSYIEAVKRDRYLTVGIFSIRIKQNNIPKIIHFSNQTNLKYKDPIFPQLTELVKKEVEFKAKKAKEFDSRAERVEE